MIKKFIRNKLRNFLGVDQLENDLQKVHERIDHLTKYTKIVIDSFKVDYRRQIAKLQEHTRVDADVGIRGNNTIILTGVYRRKAYVHFYDVGDGEFHKLVEQLESMREYALVRHIDAPPNFKGVFDL